MASLKLGFERFLQNVTHPAKHARGQPIRTARTAKKAGRKLTRKLVLVRSASIMKLEYRCGVSASVYSQFNSASRGPDVNECSGDPPPCKEDQFCLNTEGSFSCKGSSSLQRWEVY